MDISKPIKMNLEIHADDIWALIDTLGGIPNAGKTNVEQAQVVKDTSRYYFTIINDKVSSPILSESMKEKSGNFVHEDGIDWIASMGRIWLTFDGYAIACQNDICRDPFLRNLFNSDVWTDEMIWHVAKWKKRTTT